MDENDAFWMVWNPNGNAPKYKHVTERSAEDEAKRLASVYPGQRFYVLEASGAFVKDDVRFIKLNHDLPF